MKKLIFLMMLSLTGCGVHLDNYQFNNATKVCESHSGVSSIRLQTMFGIFDMDDDYKVYCSDGSAALIGEAHFK